MIVCTCTLLILLFHLTRGKDCVIDNRSKETAWEQQLKKDLIACADQNEPPDRNNTDVLVRFIVKSFNFDDREEVFSINSWLFLLWNDPRLKWNPDEYDGIRETLIPSTRIWNPNFKHYTAHGYDDLDYFFSICKVDETGYVACILRRLLESVCSTKLSDWPYDTQNCTFKFGKKSPVDNVTFTFNSSRAVSMLGAEYGPGWTIIDYSNAKNPDSDIQLHFSFILERQGVSLAAVVVTPPLVLSILTVLSMLLNIKDKVRLSIQCFSLLCQFYFMQEISDDIPKHSVDSPSILIFLRTSIVLTLAGIGITFFTSHLCRRTAPPANYIVTSCEGLLEPYGKYFIWPRWKIEKEDKDNEDASKILSVWIDFASIVNFVSMLITIMTYIVLYFAYVPRQLPEF